MIGMCKKEVKMKMDELIAAIASKHKQDGISLNPPASTQEIEAFERKLGFLLPGDFIEFYSICNGFSCTEDIFNMKSLEDMLEYPDDFGKDWFHFSDYMINSDMWSLRKKAAGDFEIINSGEVTIMLASSLYTFLERFLKGNVFDPGGLYDWHDEMNTADNIRTPLSKCEPTEIHNQRTTRYTFLKVLSNLIASFKRFFIGISSISSGVW